MDIYFLKEYGELYEEVEGGKLQVFKLESKLGKVTNMFIKREIPMKVNGITYYDITTPYGYGGPRIVECKNSRNREELINEYEKQFAKYCKKNKIVSEFIRFHPFIKNHNDFYKVYEIEYMRKTIGTNLRDYDDPCQEEFSKSGRQIARKLFREGVTFELEEDPKKLKDFINIYKSTMDRNEASKFYYFGEDYFKEMLDNLPGHVMVSKALYKGEVIAVELYLLYDNYIHAHLSGTLNKYVYLSPSYVLKYGIAKWGKENGYELIHYGGGISNSSNDSLLEFKKRFGKNTEFNFYIGKKVWNNNVYKKLCKHKNVENEEFFPIYRAPDID